MEMNARIDCNSEACFTVANPNSEADSADVVFRDQQRLRKGYLAYSSPQGSKALRGYLVRPACQRPPLPAVLVIHDDQGLTPAIEEVVDRMAAAGLIAFAPETLPRRRHSRGAVRSIQGRTFLESEKVLEDFIAAAGFLQSHWAANGEVAVIGVGRGSCIADRVIERMPSVMQAQTMATKSA